LGMFQQYTADSSDSGEEEEPDWDAAHRISDEDRRQDARPLCEQCGHPLKRFARLPTYSVLLKCGASRMCGRCGDPILAGEMHFYCRACKLAGQAHAVCRSCGPGVYIEREYDYVDSCTGEIRVRSVPENVIHERKQRRRLKPSSRGLSQGSFVLEAAGRVVSAAKQLAEQVGKDDAELFDREWDDPSLLSTLLGLDDMEDIADMLTQLAEAVEDVVKNQPTLAQAPVPCKIFGDTHGQLRDVLLLFHNFGLPGTADCPAAVFNGDMVDRGHHQVELLCVLFSLKLLFPESVFLNRGNHEDKSMNERYGFKNACGKACGPKEGNRFFEACEAVFAQLPLATLVGEKVLALHGGIGDGTWLLKDLKAVQRPLWHKDLQANDWLWNILWSDPIEDDSDEASRKVFGAHPSPRSKTAVKFGWDVTSRFCAMNGVDLIVRSHQAKTHGLGFDVMHNEMLVRVFSARDYENHRNDGAILSVTEDSDHPGVFSIRAQVLAALSEK